MSDSIEVGQPVRSVLRSPRRLVLASLGLACVGLALVGVIVPGLPTTVFLIAATYLFTRSCPWLEERFVRARVFRPFLPYVRGDRPMPTRARVVAIAMMWAAVSISVATLAGTGRAFLPVCFAIVAAAGVGTIAILRVAREAPARRP